MSGTPIDVTEMVCAVDRQRPVGKNHGERNEHYPECWPPRSPRCERVARCMISIATAILRGAVCFRASADYFEIELEPCYRDYLNAQFDGPVGPDWRVV